jgi:hypothetical protein
MRPVVLASAIMILSIQLSLMQTASADDGNQAAVIVLFGPDLVETACVSFSEPQISGLDLLSRAGIDLEAKYEGMGASVCRIKETGCPPDDCFCQCGGSECTYWSYWHYRDDNWQYAHLGASSYQVTHGDVDGWSWGPGSVTSALEPPSIPFEQICTDSRPRENSQQAIQEKELNRSTLFLGTGVVVALLIFAGINRRNRRFKP